MPAGLQRRIIAHLAAFLTGMIVFGVVGLSSSEASAQEAPLKMVFLKSDPDDGDQTYEKLRGVLEASDDIQLIPSTQLLAQARNEGLSLETFRSSEQRIDAADQFMRAMKAAQVEAIIVYDIFGGGRTVQLVAIGPWGSELSDVRERVSRPVSDNEALALFKEAFSMLIPQVRAFRAEQQAKAQRESDMQQEQDSLEEELMGSEEKTSLKDQVVEEQRRAYGNLKTGLEIRGGAIFGYRAMDLSTTADFTLDHSTPLAGIAGRLDTIFLVSDGERQAFGASLWGHFAPFKTTFNTGDSTNIQEYPGQFINFGVDLTYLRGLSSEVVLRGNLGTEITSIRLNPNRFYTGNRYIYARAGIGIMYRIAELIDINVDALLLPVLSSELSGNDFGSSNVHLAFGLDSSLDFRFLDPFLISVRYGLRSWNATYPDPNVIPESASTSDLAHMANVFVGFRF